MGKHKKPERKSAMTKRALKAIEAGSLKGYSGPFSLTTGKPINTGTFNAGLRRGKSP